MRSEPAQIESAMQTKETTGKAAALLDEAKTIVAGPRQEAYGSPVDNLNCIADLWSTFLSRRKSAQYGRDCGGVCITGQDVAAMMILLKLARLAQTPEHKDSLLDSVGYAACYAEFLP